MVLLGHQGHLAVQGLLGQGGQVRSLAVRPARAHCDPPAGRRVDASEHASQGGLARSRRSDDDQPLARDDLQVDVVEHVMTRPVGVGDPAHARRLGDHHVTGGLTIRLDELNPDDASQGGRGRLHRVQPEGDLMDRPPHLDGIQSHRRHRSQSDHPVTQQPGTPGQDRQQRQHDGDTQARNEHDAQPQRVLLGLPHLPQRPVQDPVAALTQVLGVHGLRLVSGLSDHAVDLRPQSVHRLVAGDHVAQVPTPQRHRDHRRGEHAHPQQR